MGGFWPVLGLALLGFGPFSRLVGASVTEYYQITRAKRTFTSLHHLRAFLVSFSRRSTRDRIHR